MDQPLCVRSQLRPQDLQGRERADLVCTHQPGIPCDIGREDSRQPPFDRLVRHGGLLTVECPAVSFDHLIRSGDDGIWNSQTNGSGRLEV
jgi:hypothetical protein